MTISPVAVETLLVISTWIKVPDVNYSNHQLSPEFPRGPPWAGGHEPSIGSFGFVALGASAHDPCAAQVGYQGGAEMRELMAMPW